MSNVIHSICKPFRDLASLFAQATQTEIAKGEPTDDPFSRLRDSTPALPAYDILAHRQGLSSSIELGRPVAADGSPIPWYTYPAVEYLTQLDARGLTIFEFGCGNSSLFWARKEARVWCVEHNPEWHAAVSAQSFLLQGLALREDKKGYAAAVGETGETFDIIVIDGVWRNECLREALPRLREDGIVILDNSDWYVDVAESLRRAGFFQVDFSGFGPCNTYCWTTSLFFPWRSGLAKRLGHPRPIGGIPVTRGEKW